MSCDEKPIADTRRWRAGPRTRGDDAGITGPIGESAIRRQEPDRNPTAPLTPE